MCSIPRNAANFSEITPFGEMDALPPPGARTLVKRKAWGGFWRSLYREVVIFAKNVCFREIHEFSLKSAHFTRNPRFVEKVTLRQRRLQKPPQNLCFIKAFRPGARAPPFSPENCENVKIPGNHRKPHEIVKIAEIRGSREKRVGATWRRAVPRPGPAGPPV